MNRLTKLITWIALAGFLWYIWQNRASFNDWGHGIRQINASWIVVLVLFETGYYAAHAVVYRHTMAVAGLRAEYWPMFQAALMVLYLNTAIPTVGISGTEPLIEYTTRTKQSPARSIIGYIMASVIEVIVLVITTAILLGITDMELPFSLQTSRLVAGAMLVIIALLYFSVRSLARDSSPLFRPLKPLARLLHRSSTWVDDLARRTSVAARDILTHPRDFGEGMLWAIVAHISEGLLFIGLFHAIGLTIDPLHGMLLYTVMMLVWFVSPTPQGIGLVEVVAAAMISRAGFSPAVAISIPLLFRGFAHWLPAFAGLLLYLRRPAIVNT